MEFALLDLTPLQVAANDDEIPPVIATKNQVLERHFQSARKFLDEMKNR